MTKTKILNFQDLKDEYNKMRMPAKLKVRRSWTCE
jgi:hypothetical protein